MTGNSSTRLEPGRIAVQVGHVEKIGARLNLTLPRDAALDRLVWVRVWLDGRAGKIRLTACDSPSERRGSPGKLLKERKIFQPTGEPNRKLQVPFAAMGKSRTAPLRFGRYLMKYTVNEVGDVVIDMPEPLLHYVRDGTPRPQRAEVLSRLDRYDQVRNAGPSPADRGREAARQEPRSSEDDIEDILRRIAELDDDQVDELTQILQKLNLYDNKMRRTILNTMRR